MTATIYVLNGPNLNLLGTRQPETYGRASLADVETLCRESAACFGLTVDFRQSNHEGEIIDSIHEAGRTAALGLVINPAGYSHTSVAILDAVLGVAIPTIEVHISNIHMRESFRHHSYVSRGAKAVICGFGIDGYRLAVEGLAAMVGVERVPTTSHRNTL
jgi:3-dehydroquinate dehydratase-2